MQTENLIINGIDHSKFDLEWAKRGGIVHILDDGIEPTIEYLCLVVPKFNELLVMILQSGNYSFFFSEFTSKRIMRMATPAECAEAGIEYIEPPARWLPINTLTTDIPVPLIVCDKKSKERGVLTGENIFGGACISGWNDDNITPTHWMPLPQPPKDE